METETSLLPTNTIDVENEDQIEYANHVHPLTLCEIDDTYCSICGETCLDRKTYGCNECGLFLHESCTKIKIPQEIHHYFHPHPLRLAMNESTDLSCKACEDSLPDLMFECREEDCEFYMDVVCAMLPTKLEQDGCTIDHILHFKHPHALILCDDEEIIQNDVCDGCEGELSTRPCFSYDTSSLSDGSESIYGCLECEFFLHERCARLPLETENPFYPGHHSLALIWSDKNDSRFSKKKNDSICQGCDRPRVNRYTYQCIGSCNLILGSCDFILGVECAFLKAPIVKLESHKHPLTLFPSVNPVLCCQICNKTCDSSNIFRCIYCDYNLHLLCGPLPCSIKDECHIDPLKLMYDFVEDGYEDDNVYCDACEQPRDPDQCVYCCKDCNFIAELKCVEAEVLRSLNGERGDVKLKTANKTRIRVGAKLFNVDTDNDIDTEDIGAKYKLVEKILSGCYTDEVLEFFKLCSEQRGNVKPRTEKQTKIRVGAMLISNVLTDNVEIDSSNKTEGIGGKYLQVVENFLSGCYNDDECDQLIELLKQNSPNGERRNVKLKTANKTRNPVGAKLISNVETDSDDEIESISAKYLEVKLHENFLSGCYTDEEYEQLIEIFKKARVRLRPSTFILEDGNKALCAHIERYERALADLQSKGNQEFVSSLFCYSLDEESDNGENAITEPYSEDFKKLMRDLDSYYEKDELLEMFFRRDYNIVRIGEHKIVQDSASVLKGLLHKYGDFTTKSKLSERLKAIFLTMFCEVIRRMCLTNVREVDQQVLRKWWKSLKLVQLAGFEIKFAIDLLYKVVQASFGMQAITSYREMKSQADKISNEIEEEESELEAKKRELEAKKRELEELKSHVDECKYAIEYESSPVLKECLKQVSELKWKKAWDGSPIMFR